MTFSEWITIGVFWLTAIGVVLTFAGPGDGPSR
jgi:hypothetical protein